MDEFLSLILIRDNFSLKSTEGKLYINGKFFCYTLEDVVRAEGIKIPAETAIPAGHYQVAVNMSERFKKETPNILNVPLFSGIRMHGGNKSTDTEGCILTAYKKIDTDTIQDSAEKNLTSFLKAQNKPIFITIVNKIN